MFVLNCVQFVQFITNDLDILRAFYIFYIQTNFSNNLINALRPEDFGCQIEDKLLIKVKCTYCYL